MATIFRSAGQLAILFLFLQAASSEPADPFRMQVPGANWAVVIDAAGFQFDDPDSNADNSRIWSFADHENPGVVLTVVIRKDDWSESPEECSEDARISRHAEDLEHSSRGPMLVTGYVVHLDRGDRVNQRHAFAHLYRGGYCIEAHLSVTDPRSKKQPRIDINAVLDSIHIVDDAN